MSRLPRTLHRFSRGGQAPRGGFTLAEVAVTLLIVSFALVLILQGLNVAKFSAAQTHNRKVARELALLTLGRVQSGLYWEDLDGEPGEIPGSYAEEGYEDWRFTIDLNLMSVIKTWKAVTEHLLARQAGGRLVVTSSAAALSMSKSRPIS